MDFHLTSPPYRRNSKKQVRTNWLQQPCANKFHLLPNAWRTQSMKIDIQTAFSLLFLFFLNRSRWTARVRRRAILFPLSTPKSPLLLIICNLPALFYFLARPWLQRKKDHHSRSNRYQSFCKLMVIELNWVKCNLVCIWSDGRAAWLKKKNCGWGFCDIRNNQGYSLII